MNKSVMWEYIFQEKEILSEILQTEGIGQQIAKYRNIESMYFVCHGSSYNAAMAVSSFISNISKVKVHIYTPSNFIYNCPTIDLESRETTMVVTISQTGTSRGTINAMQLASKKGFRILTLTDVLGTPVDKLSDDTLYLQCATEESNAKTKGYSSTLLMLMLTGLLLGCAKGIVNEKDRQSIMNEFRNAIADFDGIINDTIDWCKRTKFGSKMENVYVIGNGMNYGTALEGQLKIMETMCIPAMSNDIEEFSHGMHRSINEDSHVILLNSAYGNEDIVKTFEYLKQKTKHVMMINCEEYINDEMVININQYPLTQSVLGMTLVIQILSVFIPELNGKDPNAYANNDYTSFIHTRI